MTGFVQRNNVSIVNAILPQVSAARVIDEVFAAGDLRALQINARGTLIRDRWYQALLPVMSPEKEILQFIVPDPEVQRIIERIVNAGDLHLPGAGAAFAVPCDEFLCTEDFPVWKTTTWENDDYDASRNFRENLTVIYCIVQTDQTDQISRAAMAAGAHGPVIFYCEGRGLRDRLGWLRITKKSEKEVVTVIVDNADAIAVTEAMINAGDIDLPGRGFLYRMPVQMGMVNIGASVGRQRHAASMHQIISAIDEIKGSSEWRDQRVNQLVGTGTSAGLNLFGKVKERKYLKKQVCLSCHVGSRHADDIIEAALAGGAPGTNIVVAKLIEAESETNERGIRFNRERAIIRSTLPEAIVSAVLDSIQAVSVEREINEVAVYTQPVTRAITYVPERSAQSTTA